MELILISRATQVTPATQKRSVCAALAFILHLVDVTERSNGLCVSSSRWIQIFGMINRLMNIIHTFTVSVWCPRNGNEDETGAMQASIVSSRVAAFHLALCTRTLI